MTSETKSETKKIAKASLAFVRQTPRKMRRAANIIRTMTAGQAALQLKHLPYAAAEPIKKLIESAMANAKNNLGVESPEELRISQLLVDDNNTYKRWRAMNKGRAYTILKRTSKLSVVLSEMDAAQYAKYVWEVSPRNKKNPKNKSNLKKASEALVKTDLPKKASAKKGAPGEASAKTGGKK